MRKFHGRNLPHLYYEDGIYFITYRLKESVLPGKSESFNRHHSRGDFQNFKHEFIKYDAFLDKHTTGLNLLLKNNLAGICEKTMHYPEGRDYFLICYCIMPNHIHLVFNLLKGNKGVSKIMQSIKRVSARKCNVYLNRTGNFWQDESYDRLIRDDVEFYFIIKYVLLNPVNAGLVKKWDDWNYSYCHPDYIVL